MATYMLLLLACCSIFSYVFAMEYVRIGALFDSEDEMQSKAFDFVIDSINNERTLLPDKFLVGMTKKVKRGDSFESMNAACDMLGQGAVGVFGPISGKSSSSVSSVCEAKDVPHVEMRIDPRQSRGKCHINFHPHPAALAKAYVDIVRAYDWESFTVIYENSESFSKLGEILKMYDDKGHTVTLRRLDLGMGDNFRDILRKVKMSKQKNIMLDCSIEKLFDILIQAQQVGLMTDDYNYIITNLDMHTIDLEPFRYGGTNITGMRLIDPNDPDVIETIQEWNSYIKQQETSQDENNQENEEQVNTEDYITPDKLRLDTALIMDAVYSFASVLKDLNFTTLTDKVFDCNEDFSWDHGSTITNYIITQKNIKGLTRDIKFDYEGFRTDFTLDVYELTSTANDIIKKTATWTPSGLEVIKHGEGHDEIGDDVSLANRSFIVLTAISKPYGMLKESMIKLEGNDRYEGFGIELIDELSKMLGFNYTFTIQEDGNYGSKQKDGSWNGMIREVLDKRADLAITDLTVTSDRESAVDFTMPFMNLGISILYKKPTKQPPSLFSFMSPFSNEVWLYLGTAYLGVSVLIFILARISPKEWQNPYPCIQEPEQLENQFSMPNSLWFTVGSVLQQGSELAPIAISTRMMAGMWWFFTLIIVSSYTANLAAFLTVESLIPAIENADDLASNTQGILYGAKLGGSTYNFFKDAEYPTYQTMYEFMKNNHDLVMMKGNDEGVLRVRKENYAFLMESTSIEYITERECDLAKVGGLLDDKGYAIAMRKNSSYRNSLSEAVLKLQERGKLTLMKTKWWKEKRGGGACLDVDDSSGGALALTLENVGGVFLVLVVGCFFAIVVTFYELLFDVWQVSREEKSDSGSSSTSTELGILNVGGVFLVLICGGIFACFVAFGELLFGVIERSKKFKVPFRQELKEELKFVIKMKGSTKPVRHRNPSKSPDSLSERSGSNKSLNANKQFEGLKVTGNGV